MKKTFFAILTAALTLSLLLVPAMAEENTEQTPGEGMQGPKYISFTGQVTEVRPSYDENGNEVDDKYYLSLEDAESGQIMVFYIDENAYVPEDTSFSNGDQVMAYYDGHAPALMIYPPQANALAVVKQVDGLPLLKVDMFDDEQVSSDGMLKLMNLDQAIVIDLDGLEYAEDLTGKVLAVYYDITTRSIPAQTTPQLVVVLERTAEETP